MKAVNLIPAEERKGGGGGGGGRSGGAAYVLLGALAVLVALLAAMTLSGRSLDDKKAELARVEREAGISESQAAELKQYTGFSGMRENRAATVKSIAASRFDWSFVMHELARTVPSNVWLTGIVGTVTPTVTLKDRATTVGVRSAQPVPALELTGCTTSQASVARMMTALRQVDGVRRVSLQSALKSDSTGAAGDSGGCGAARFPTFAMAIFFDAKAQPAAPAAAAATPPAGTATAATGSTKAVSQTTTTEATP